MAAKLETGLSPKSLHHHHAVLRRALHVAASYGYVSRNVAKLVSPPTVREKEVMPPTPEQVATLLEAATGDRFQPLYVLALTTGMRQSELLGLQWAAVDSDAGVLRVTRTLQRYEAEFHLDDPKTVKSRRSIALSAPAVDALKAQRSLQNRERLRAGKLWEGADWGLVFASDDGSPLHGNKVTRAFQLALTRAGLPKFRFHDLRHCAATFILSQGTELKVIQEVLGHSTIAITSKTYAHVMPTLQREATDRLGSLVGSRVKP